ncbi:efflux RND transporter periplasmic adaptor subunit [Candidatus Nitronereus thalassa]|uniref:Efflux RND transporter periplasmic adaptor subunit n=1 Tax=Candidatus Nitronereus thalassa TaxID=3020898 RepID=A0ABU3K9J4_9BACT|nr:efflux RND transporter periplasmic adaptor subunit [Candidatus Nitronereus thalassa]MDT7043120.1 efflux RND transporter periplasmic adaptor subunit [Candidatus Nitronereus thalassa]
MIIKKKHSVPFLVCISLCGLITILGACSEQHPPEAEELIRPVRSQQVFLTGSDQVRTFSGTAQAGLEAKLSFKVAGTLQKLFVKVGDKVKQGQVLASLDSQDYQLQVQRAEAALARAKASARSAAADYSRVRALYENRNASRNDLDQARAAAESSQAEVSSSAKDLELARLQLDYTRLSAPAACYVASVPVEVNENVQAGKIIMEVVCGSRLEVEVGIPEVFIARVKRGSAVTVTFDAIPGLQFPALVTKVGVASGQTGTTFPVTVQLQQAVPGFRSGLAAEVTFRFEGRKGEARILVPPVAVGEDPEGRYVYVLDELNDGIGRVKRTPVVIGELSPEGLEIIDGLQDGARIVTAGVRRIHDGQRVRLMGDAADER